MSTKIFEIMHVASICGSHFISKDKDYIKELAKQLVCPGENEEKEEGKNSEHGANDVLDRSFTFLTSPLAFLLLEKFYSSFSMPV